MTRQKFEDGMPISAQDLNDLYNSNLELKKQLDALQLEFDDIKQLISPLKVVLFGGKVCKRGSKQAILLSWQVLWGNTEIVPDRLTINNAPYNPALCSATFVNIGVTTSFTVHVKKGKFEAEATVVAEFVPPIYCGVLSRDVELNEDSVKQLTEYIFNTKAFNVHELNSNGHDICFAYPKSYGKLRSIKSAEGFECICMFHCTEVLLDNVPYFCYRTISPSFVENYSLFFM